MEDQREAVCDLHKYARVPTRLTLPTSQQRGDKSQQIQPREEDIQYRGSLAKQPVMATQAILVDKFFFGLRS